MTGNSSTNYLRCYFYILLSFNYNSLPSLYQGVCYGTGGTLRGYRNSLPQLNMSLPYSLCPSCSFFTFSFLPAPESLHFFLLPLLPLSISLCLSVCLPVCVSPQTSLSLCLSLSLRLVSSLHIHVFSHLAHLLSHIHFHFLSATSF